MFTTTDFLSMKDYFFFLSTDGNEYFEVISKNTRHRWKVIGQKYFYKLFHAHNLTEPYHLHGTFSDMFDCILEIVDHDEWKLNVWRHKHKGKWVQPKTYFDELVEKYGSHKTYIN